MSWQLINSVLRYTNSQGLSFGYLKGGDNERSYYCFRQSPWISNSKGPFISRTWLPKLVDGDGTNYNLSGITYCGDYVFQSYNAYIFYSPSQLNYVKMSELREPYYYTDIDETTKVGDKFFTGSFPSQIGETVTWTQSGAVNTENESNATLDITLTQDVWYWNNNGDRSKNLSGFCGVYLNPDDQTLKFVGIPTFTAEVNNNDDYFRNETFTRSLEKQGGSWGHFTYIGDKGHTIAYDTRNALWCIGTVNSGKWSQSSQEPSAQSPVTFTGYEMDTGTGQPVADPKGDFILNFAHREMGDTKQTVNMGEVSLWRP